MGRLKKVLTIGQRDDFYTDKSKSVQGYLKDIRKTKPMTAAEEKDAFKRYHAGDMSARKRIIESYQLYVYAAARQYATNGNLLDLVNEGNLGLIEALERFDTESGNRFISFASHYIKKNLCYYIQMNSDLVKNIYYNRTRKKVTECSDAFFAINGREPSDDELWEILPLATKKVLQKKDNLHGNSSISISESLDSKSTFETSPEFNAASAGDSEGQIYAQFEKSDNDVLIKSLMSGLCYREKEVIKRLFGIGCRAESDYEVSMRLGLATKTVRAIKNTAISRMRSAAKKREKRI